MSEKQKSLNNSIRSITEIIQFTSFSFLLGNILMDNIFGKREFSKNDLVLYKKLKLTNCIIVMITGFLLNYLIVSEKKYNEEDEKYIIYNRFFRFKLVFTFMSFYGVDIFGELFKDQYKDDFINYSRIICTFSVLCANVFQRDYKETILDSKEVNKVKKD